MAQICHLLSGSQTRFSQFHWHLSAVSDPACRCLENFLVEEKVNCICMDVHIQHNPTALRKAKIVCNFGLSECNRVKTYALNNILLLFMQTFEESSCSVG